MLSKIINDDSLHRFREMINHVNDVVITTHISPDGDAMGSSLAMMHYLKQKGKNVKVIVPNEFPDFLAWLPGANDVILYNRKRNLSDELIMTADLVISLDYNALSRVGDMSETIRLCKSRKLLIDHHLDPEGFADIMISHPQMCSTAELVFRFICALGDFDEISYEGAECIYTGMMTDTGGFTYNSNSQEIYFIISELLTKGIDKDEIYRKVCNTYSEARLRLMGLVLTNMEIFNDCHTALITLTTNEQSKFNYTKGDSEGFVNIPLSMKNIIFSCFLREDSEANIIKISLRSAGNFPCNEFARQYFNGGGHLNASGGQFVGTMDEAKEHFKNALKEYKEKLIANF